MKKSFQVPDWMSLGGLGLARKSEETGKKDGEKIIDEEQKMDVISLRFEEEIYECVSDVL